MELILISNSDPAVDAAVYGAWVIRDQPFPENNREIGYEVMCQMLRDAGLPWPQPEEDAAEVEAMLKDVEAGRAGVPEFVDWVRRRVATA